MAIHFFCTSGAVTSVAPSATQIDTATTATGTGSNGIMATKLKNVRLLRVVQLKVPTSADVLTVSDSSANALFSATLPANLATPPIDFGPSGIPCPIGGFIVTTTQATGAYIYVFDADGTIAS